MKDTIGARLPPVIFVFVLNFTSATGGTMNALHAGASTMKREML